MRSLYFSFLTGIVLSGAAIAHDATPYIAGDPQSALEQLSDQQKDINEHPEKYLGDALQLQRVLHPNVDPSLTFQADEIARNRPQQKNAGARQKEINDHIANAGCTVKVFASMQFIEQNLVGLANEALEARESPRACETIVYLRGLPKGSVHIEDLLRWFYELEKKVPAAKRGFSLFLDPSEFRKNNINEFPVALIRERNVTAIARGTGSPHYMMERLSEGQSGDLGRVGETGAIPEQDLIEDLQKRLAQIDWKTKKAGAISRFMNHMQRREFAKVEKTTSTLLDMSVRTDSDLKDNKGKVLVPKGTEVNPAKLTQMRLAMVAFDPEDSQQVEFAHDFAHRAAAAGLRVKYLVTGFTGSERQKAWEATEDNLHQQIYLLDERITDRFNIDAIPSAIVADRGQVLVTKVHLDPQQAVDGSVAIPGYDRVRVSSADADTNQAGAVLTALFQPLRILADVISTDARADSSSNTSISCPNAQIFGAGLVSDVCWNCIFPLTIGGEEIIPGNSIPSEHYSGSPICFCPAPPPIFEDPGITLGLWRPINMIETVRQAYCFPTLDGTQLSSSRLNGSDTPAAHKYDTQEHNTYYNYHMYEFPLLQMLNLFTGANCGSAGSDFDLTYISEIDPTWNDDELADMLNPESVLFTNPVAEAACLADAAAAYFGEPIGALFWCAGTWGFMYPFSGTDQADGSIPRDTSLIATRAIAALHRRGLMNLTMGYPTLCMAYPTMTIPKGQYKLEAMYPIPETGYNHWIGESTFEWGEWRSYAGPGEDFVYLVWGWRDCCDTLIDE